MENKQAIQATELKEALLNDNKEIIGGVLNNKRPYAVWLARKYDLDDPENVASDAIAHILTNINSVKWEEKDSPENYIFKAIKYYVIDQVKLRKVRFSGLMEKELSEIDGTPPDYEDWQKQDYKHSSHGIWVKGEVGTSPQNQPKYPVLRHLMRYFNVPSLTDFIKGWEHQEPIDYNRAKKQYMRTKSLVDALPSSIARERMTKYLIGLSPTQIANQGGVYKQAVWKMITPYLRLWKWDKMKVERVRMLWLVFALRDIGRKALQKRCASHTALSPIDSRNDYLERLYKLIVEDARTKAYFGDLPKDDIVHLDRLLEGLSWFFM